MYRRILLREPDPESWGGAAQALVDGSMDEAALKSRLAESDECQRTTNPARKLIDIAYRENQLRDPRSG